MEIGSMRLKELRLSKNLSQIALAKSLEISPRNYQRYEYGEREPTVSTLTAIADFFNVSIDYLVGRTDNPKMN